MRILIDVLHPAHVYFFRNFHREMTDRGHDLYITARDKDHSIELLDSFGLPYEQISTQQSGAKLAVEMVQRTHRLLDVMRRFRPDVMTGIMGPSIVAAGAIRHIPAVVFYDTEFARQTNSWVYPLAYSVCTPDCYHGRVPGRHPQYRGYHELAYLHPNRFHADPGHLADFGVDPGEPYTVVRFVSWQAAHDRREIGLTLAKKIEIIERLASRGRVFVSSEAELQPDLAQFAVKGPINEIHHLLAFAQLVVGESATMCSEAAVLGVPSVFIAKSGRGYTDDEERRYGLVHHFTDAQYSEAVHEIDRILDGSPREFGSKAREKMLSEKIDVTRWIVDYFESTFARA